MAKLLKLRRGTTSQHGSFTGAEGEVTVDLNKDTLVVHDGSTQSGHTLLREDLSNLPAGQIDNADVNASAAIAGTKISPDFGSQGITTTGGLGTGNYTITSDAPTITFTDNDNNPDYKIITNGGAFLIHDSTNGTDKIKILNNAEIDITPNVDFANGIDVTGNITVSGTVDGVDIAARNTLFGGLTSSSGVLSNGVTGTTQSQSDNSTKVATTAYVRSAVAGVVDSAPAALDTLNELAAALGDDANFATTTANSIGTKLPLAGGQMTGNITFSGSQTVDGRDLSVDGAKLDNIEANATQDQSAAEILTAIKTVDGSGSGLDADTLDGVQASGFIRTNNGAQDINGSLTCDDVIVAGAMLHEGDTNTLVHFTANDEISMKTNGSTRLRAHNSGVDVTGALVASGNVTAFSDARLKTDISTINDALGIVEKLRGVSYKWLKNGSEGIGVIAQEVEQVIPEVVLTNVNTDPSTGETTEIKSVDYGNIVGVLINAINELKAEVDELKGGK